MIEKILQWGGTAFAIVGVVLLFLEAIGSIRKRNNTKLSILGLVFLSISLVGYLLTEVILRSQGLPVIFSCLWILFMWAYLICNLVSAIKLSRQAGQEKKAQRQLPQDGQTEQADVAAGEVTVQSEQLVTEQEAEQAGQEESSDNSLKQD